MCSKRSHELCYFSVWYKLLNLYTGFADVSVLFGGAVDEIIGSHIMKIHCQLCMSNRRLVDMLTATYIF